jgi:hypothetical protein
LLLAAAFAIVLLRSLAGSGTSASGDTRRIGVGDAPSRAQRTWLLYRGIEAFAFSLGWTVAASSS